MLSNYIIDKPFLYANTLSTIFRKSNKKQYIYKYTTLLLNILLKRIAFFIVHVKPCNSVSHKKIKTITF